MAVALDFDAVVPQSAKRSILPSARRFPAAAAPAALSCLVATGDVALRRRLVAAAELAGWDVEALAADRPATQEAGQLDFQLVVIDLANAPGGDRAALETLGAEVGSRPATLLLVCGSAGSVDHESWARTAGAFLHVPGVADGDSLVGWFSEARAVAERRSFIARRSQVLVAACA